MAAAYASFVRRIASEILLVDRDRSRAEGEAMDLMHAQALVGRVRVGAVDWPELERADVVLIAAGRSQRHGESRLDLAERNADVIREVMDQLDRHAPRAVVVVATNPVDLLTMLAIRITSRPEGRVFGTGTMLDSVRFRTLIGEHFTTSPRSVHAYVLGEHGDSEVPVWSNATVGGVPITAVEIEGKRLDDATRTSIAECTRHAAGKIIECKGYTNLAIGVVMAQLADVVMSDQRSVHSVSVLLHGEYGLSGIALGLPCVVGANGIAARIVPELSPEELALLRRSAAILSERAQAAKIT